MSIWFILSITSTISMFSFCLVCPDYWWAWNIEILHYKGVKDDGIWALVMFLFKYWCPWIWGIVVENWSIILVDVSLVGMKSTSPSPFGNFSWKSILLDVTLLIFVDIGGETLSRPLFWDNFFIFDVEEFLYYAAK